MAALDKVTTERVRLAIIETLLTDAKAEHDSFGGDARIDEALARVKSILGRTPDKAEL